MNSTELRIGNWVEQNKLYFKFASVDFELWEFNGDLSPIPLTEEWLVKFGFEETEHGFRKFSFTVDKWAESQLMYGWIGGNIELKHVHHLQNVFFCLVGEELEIKESL